MPTKRNEAYLYCPVFEALEKNWGVNIKRLQPAITDDNLFHCAVPGIKTTSIYFTNDTWHGNDFIDLGNGAVACSMKYASAHYGDILKSYYGAILQDETDGFSSLNSLLVQDGIFIYIPQGVKVQLPIQVLNVMYAKQRLMSIGRNLIIMEPESELHYIDCVHTMNETEYFQITRQAPELSTGAILWLSLRRHIVRQECEREVRHADDCGLCMCPYPFRGHRRTSSPSLLAIT